MKAGELSDGGLPNGELPDSGLQAREQPFEASFLGGPVWRATCTAPVDDAAVAGFLEAARRGGVRLITCRLPEGAPMAGPLLRAGFRLVEVLVTFEHDLAEGFSEPPVPVSPAGPEDCAGCVAIGSRAFAFDRFHRDRDRIGDVGDAIKAAWVGNAFAGRADAILVTRHGGRPTGFVLCQHHGDAAVIDLIAVNPALRGQGLGRSLALGVLAHYAGSVCCLRVGTQDDNAASNRLYRSVGFRPVERQTTFHWTPDSAP